MNLVALSRANIEGQAFRIANEPPASMAICIAYPGSGRLHAVRPGGHLKGVLHLRFSDCDGEGRWRFPDHKSPESIPIPMTRGQAVDVLDFVRARPPEVETIYCACFGGVSRSRGVLWGIGQAFGWDTAQVLDHGDPSPWCRNLIVIEAQERLQ